MKILGGAIPEMCSLTYAERVEEKIVQLRASSTNFKAHNKRKAPIKRTANLIAAACTKRAASTRSMNAHNNPSAMNTNLPLSNGASNQVTNPVPRNSVPPGLNFDLDDISDIFDDSMLANLLNTAPASSTNTTSQLVTLNPPKATSQNKPEVISLDDVLSLSDWDDDDFM
ncbi:hypothetical protein DSO57_1026054 [Entomophthora muscae]|uniref:Uncharacterized protein n=1 Tax=Entomophthora muscae TaxID=34485 RepID=A0ACC2SRE6_9FUNG|nr:hypothetical protein DSO57_1026054 [Entomophthora muscae]